jgi:hypothetical protein
MLRELVICICSGNQVANGRSDDWWNIDHLRQDAEWEAKYWRRCSFAVTIATLGYIILVCILVLTAIPWMTTPQQQDITPAIIKCSALLILAAFLILVSRIVWNYSNVWLGRAGTLEDLGLALRLLNIELANPPALSDADAQRLLRIVESFERLRRSFEGDLLKGPAFEVPKVSK